MSDIIALGDPHIGSTVGLCTPSVNLDDGGTYHASRAQRWIYAGWERFLDRCAKLTDPIIILNGDLCEGDTKNRSHQIITRNKATIKRLTVDLLEPLARMGSVYVVRGTAAHTGKSGAMEEDIADDLDAVKSDTGTCSHWSLLMQVGGVRLDVAHHCSMGGMPWNKGAAAPKLAARAVFTYAERGERPPDIVIRSHVHQWGDSYDAYPTRALILPAWTLATEYVNSLAPNSVAQIGSAIIRTDGKRYEIEKFRVEPEKRKWVKA